MTQARPNDFVQYKGHTRHLSAEAQFLGAGESLLQAGLPAFLQPTCAW
jgi:hypothetical protein